MVIAMFKSPFLQPCTMPWTKTTGRAELEHVRSGAMSKGMPAMAGPSVGRVLHPMN
jgi:hypothetical protein